ncbi:MAG: PD-(D/E)XK nuclease family protein [Nitrospirae bacterium]|nr:PD-(D/E)XK nuclease family protein [Nitrospirota bacterium]
MQETINAEQETPQLVEPPEVICKPYLSYSQISMFMRCPRQYEYRYIEGIKRPPSGAMKQSSAFHETAEVNYKQKVFSETDIPLSDMKDIFAERFDFIFNSEEIVFDEGDNKAKLKDKGIEIVEVHHTIITPTVQPQLVEEKFKISLGDDFPYDLLGIWDVVDINNLIIDNKAYSKTPSQDDVDKDLQLTAYALGFRASRQQIEKGLRIDAIIKNKTCKAVQINTTRTNMDCRWLLKSIEQIVQAIKGGVFYPNSNGWHCSQKFCGYWDMCKGGH